MWLLCLFCFYVWYSYCVVISSAHSAQDTLAKAQLKAQWQSKQLATEAIASHAIENLLRKNQVPHFHLLILDALNQKQELDRYTRAQLQKIVNKQLPQNSQKLINETLEYVAKQAIKLRQDTR